VRGRELLRQADVIVHDRLIGRELLTHARGGAEIVDVGKAPGRHRISQHGINNLLIDRASRGLCVVRLKGGDPFVFGRGFEELTACRAADVECVVVPGVSSAFAAPLSAGIPVSMRGVARGVLVVTAEDASGHTDLDYKMLAQADTLVILMGRAKLDEVTRSLMQAGKPTSTPAACIERATSPRQRVVVSTLSNIADEADRAGLTPPIVTVIGEVAALANEGARGPLAGKRIMITRPQSTSRELERRLCAAGASPISCPMIRIVYPPANDALDNAIRELHSYDWVVFTSSHAVIAFRRRLSALKLDARVFSSCKVAAVGPATVKKLTRLGVKADLVPTCHRGASLAEAMLAADPGRPLRVLYPRGDRKLAGVTEPLGAVGGRVDEVVAYSTIDATPSPSTVSLLREGVDAILFFSPSAVQRFAALGLDAPGALVACIGPTTARAAQEAGMTVDLVSPAHNVDGLVEAMEQHFLIGATA
jgi:uroporphyrinogen III methyltransferase/synthase